MSYIISWSGEIGRIMIEDTMFDILDKPNVGFEFDALYYEVPTSLFIKVLNGETVNLTEEEKASCVKYCLDFKESDDFPVIAIDPSYNIYMDVMSRGNAKNKGFNILTGIEAPSYSPAIYEDETWVHPTKAITSKGKLVDAKDYISSDMVIVFTDKTWKEFPHPSNSHMIYDFITETWIDNRDFTSTLEKAKAVIRGEAVVSMGSYDVLKTTIDPVLFLFQYDELKNYKKDSTTPTPFVDAVCKEMGIDKDTFMQRIDSKYNEDRLSSLGMIHGKMIKYLDMLSECKTLEDIDSIMNSISFTYSSPWTVKTE